MRPVLLPAFALAVFGVAMLAPAKPAEALMGLSRQAVAPLTASGAAEEAASRNKRTARRRAYRHPRYTQRRYAPFACARPHQYYYWQFWPPVCYPL